MLMAHKWTRRRGPIFLFSGMWPPQLSFIGFVLTFVGISFACGSRDGTLCNSLTSPCCSEAGYCGTGAEYCLVKCQASGSNPLAGCYSKISCKSGIYTFENETGQVTNMTPISSYVNSSDYEGFVWEKGNLQLTPQNDTIMKVSYSSGSTPEFAYGEGSRFSSVFYSQYGEYEAQIKASNGVGMVTSFITMSDDGDEIDFEILGKSILKITTNYFHKGVLDFTKAEYHDVGVNVSAAFHTYGIKWTPDCIEWWFDSRLLRSVYKNSTDKTEDGKYKYPTSPSRIMFGIWDGAETRQKGTMKWTGRSIWNEEAKKNRYSAYVKSVKIACNGVDRRNLTAIRFMPNSVRAETGMPSKAAPSWLFQTSTDLIGFIVIAILFILQ